MREGTEERTVAELLARGQTSLSTETARFQPAGSQTADFLAVDVLRRVAL